MALFHISMRSDSLGMNTNLYVILPSDTSALPQGGYPVLYLFHGLSDDHTKWLRSTRIEEYAAKYDLCVVMPEVQCGFYCNMKNGLNYDDYITKDLPAFIEKTFPVTRDRARTFVAGLSMGGFGAIKTGLREYGKYGACAGLSAVIHPFEKVDGADEGRVRLARSILGDTLTLDQKDDPYKLAEGQASLPEEQRTRLYMAIGTEDFLYEDNVKFRKVLDGLGFAYTYEEAPGHHNWDFWDKYIQNALAFFFDED